MKEKLQYLRDNLGNLSQSMKDKIILEIIEEFIDKQLLLENIMEKTKS